MPGRVTKTICKSLLFIVAGPLDQATGGYQYDAQVVAGLRDSGWCVEVAELEGRFPDADRYATDALARTLARAVTGQIVIVDGLVLGGLAAVAARHAERLCLVALVHHALVDEAGVGSDSGNSWLSRERAALATADKVITTSHYTARRLVTLALVATTPAVVEPGVAPRAPATPSLEPPVRLCCVASITARKNHPVLIDALACIADLDWCCHLVGALDRDPATVSEVRERIDRYALANRVQLTGKLSPDALEASYRQAGLFVLASRFEGYGMVITEALAYGLPIVTSNGGALRDTLPPAAGLSVPPDDVEALATALRQPLTDPALFDALKSGAAEARWNLSDWAACTVAFNTIIQTVQARHD